MSEAFQHAPVHVFLDHPGQPAADPFVEPVLAGLRTELADLAQNYGVSDVRIDDIREDVGETDGITTSGVGLAVHVDPDTAELILADLHEVICPRTRGQLDEAERLGVRISTFHDGEHYHF